MVAPPPPPPCAVSITVSAAAEKEKERSAVDADRQTGTRLILERRKMDGWVDSSATQYRVAARAPHVAIKVGSSSYPAGSAAVPALWPADNFTNVSTRDCPRGAEKPCCASVAVRQRNGNSALRLNQTWNLVKDRRGGTLQLTERRKKWHRFHIHQSLPPSAFPK